MLPEYPVSDSYHAAHQTHAVFELSDWAIVDFTGGDRARFLHNFCTNDIKGLGTNDGCEVIFTNIQAGSLGHGFVFSGDESHQLLAATANLDGLLAHLNKYLITDDVEITRRYDRELYLAAGPDAGDFVAHCADVPISARESLFRVSSGTVSVYGVDILSVPTFVVSAPLGSRPLGDAVRDADALEALRLEAGFPVYGRDFTVEHSAPEVNRVARTISYTKGCYLGQEPIARIDAMGRVNKSLHRIHIDGPVAPEEGAKLSTADGTVAATITTAAMIPGRDSVAALAWVKRAFTDAGTALSFNGAPALVVE